MGAVANILWWRGPDGCVDRDVDDDVVVVRMSFNNHSLSKSLLFHCGDSVLFDSDFIVSM
jgi:hypothetical protein